MTTQTLQEIEKHLSAVKGDSILADTLRDFAKKPIKSTKEINDAVDNIQNMIGDNAQMMLEILGEKGFDFFVNYESKTAFAPTADEGEE